MSNILPKELILEITSYLNDIDDISKIDDIFGFTQRDYIWLFLNRYPHFNGCKPKIYIDYLQNSTGQTLASVYSVRPVLGASVSTPLEWKEVNHQLSPKQFTMQNIFQRLKKKGDLFLPVLNESNSIDKALKALNG